MNNENPLFAVDAIINAKVKSMIDSGAIANMIESKVESTISDVVESELRSYSDFGKSLKDYINKSLQVNFDSLGFEGYHENLLRVISKVYENSMQSEHLEKVKKMTEEMLANPPELVTLSSLVSAVKEKAMEHAKENEEADNDGYTYEGNITCIIQGKEDRFFTYINLDEKEGVRAYDCNYRIGISKGRGESEIFSVRINDKDTDSIFVQETYGLERLLFKAKCASSKFQFDIEDVDTSYSVDIEPECHC